MKPLEGFRVLTLAPNVPGPVAAERLRGFGALVTKVEPPAGDPLASFSPGWYAELSGHQEVVVLDLKTEVGRSDLDGLLADSDLLFTSSRPAALARLGLAWDELHRRFPRLSQVALVGYPAPGENRPGHDLTYLAGNGLLSPPEMPRTLLADLAGAERAASTALGLLLARERGGGVGYIEVALSEAAEAFAAPFAHGLTRPGGVLGGGFAGYGLYPSSDGWVAVAVLEPHFMNRLALELGIEEVSQEKLERAFRGRSSSDWEAWANRRDLPILAVRGL
ncbi:CoA transferase [Rubrobacter indicoceani]|uniref:CoA transferase n=1 Tax=Rubrobacter indicoceani TaxID=2051957 RepID=UPI000E5A9B9E|nr:CoA transferase [Rubrobacter indicoceani]